MADPHGEIGKRLTLEVLIEADKAHIKARNDYLDARLNNGFTIEDMSEARRLGYMAQRAVLVSALRPPPPTCATCKWCKPSQVYEGDFLCTKEPQEWPMHWRETWPTFGCNGHEPTQEPV